MIRRTQVQRSYVSPKLLIVTEGKETERRYIAALRISKSIPAQRVEILPHECTDPLTLVQQVVQEREARVYLGKFDSASGDQVWAVFDVDEHRQNDQTRFSQAIQLARNESVILAHSNPSFELWLILHYVLQTANIHRRQALDRVKQELTAFDKTLPDGEARTLIGKLQTALSNAQALRQRNENMPPPIDAFRNPSTDFDQLVRKILSIA